MLLVLGIIACRVLAFQPGVTESPHRARRNRFRSNVAIIAWIADSILAPAWAADQSNAVLLSVSEFCSAITIEGVATLPLALLPFVNFEDFELIEWKRWVWMIAYLVGVCLFIVVLVPVPESWAAAAGSLLLWVLIFAGFAGFAILAMAIWGIDIGARRRAAHRSPRITVP